MPSTATATAPIPVIDLAATGKSEQEVAKELCDAAIEHGFIYIRSDGVDVSVEAVDKAFEIVSLFSLLCSLLCPAFPFLLPIYPGLGYEEPEKARE